MPTAATAGPTAIVTGATSGIGAAIAARLATEGFRLVLTGRRRPELEAVMARVTRGNNVVVQKADLRDPAAAKTLVSTALSAFGSLDVVVNNAGIASLVPIAEVTPELLADEMTTNALGPAQLICAAWPVFVRQRSGIVVNVSSLSAVDPLPGFLSYGASKAALESLGRSVAREGREFGIRAYNIEPGAVDTPLLAKLFREAAPQTAVPPEAIAEVVVACIEGKTHDAWEGAVRVNP